MAARWAEVLDLPLADDTTVSTDDATIAFRAGRPGEGLDEVAVAAGRSPWSGRRSTCAWRVSFV